ncbi:hypothetical protein AMR42_09470 [Limnothrix sp. PR1529]|uniref:Npun_R2821/Npun_R2822 family protein n=1 Tax=Limnothrix sp. PR1529 TaxID=1704291 RepID=UPI00081F380B|nr:Npun_R2821/Npun_R2822 family protein [Limnothrix sp. PR1529]OCQ93949.1 hypothetical protein BCR12_05325 [Limnothrix sp. P13C2]PIB11618.1 hypothetical protein AMR42_09470 [Limnothrix sp. PR1529]
MDGLYTLANDVVLDQLIAFLNSVEANGGRLADGSPYPVLVCPYDHRIDRLKTVLADWPHVQILEDWDLIARWDQFSKSVIEATPLALQLYEQEPNLYGRTMGGRRRLAAFDGPFDRFIYLDADTLVLQPLAPLFAALETADWVTYDFQYKDPAHVYRVASPLLQSLFSTEQMQQSLFCSGLYATKRGVLTLDRCDELLKQLQAGESDVLYPRSADQALLNYLVMRSNLKVHNCAHHWPKEQVTGNSVTSKHFVERSGQVFDRDRPLLYLHYIGLSSSLFSRVCAGENITFPYRDTFLHYRYLKHPQQRPRLVGRPRAHNAPPSLWERAQRKFKQKFKQWMRKSA